MPHEGPVQQFTDALDALVEQVKHDRSILAALLCGSLSHDTVWAGSDIDLVLVTVDDRTIQTSDLPLYADGVNVHASLIPRAEFRKIVDGATQHSFMHSLLAKGRLLYTHDETLEPLCARLHQLGDRDRELQMLRAATGALYAIYKARKWLLTRGDLDYTALWILYAATPLAQIEVIGAGLIADREVIPQASALNPALFRTVYSGLLNAKKTRATVEAALAAADGYLTPRLATLFRPIIDHLREAGEARSARDLEHHFTRHFSVPGVTTACEYLADHGLVGKVSVPTRLTKRSTVDVEELAFVYLDEPES